MKRTEKYESPEVTVNDLTMSVPILVASFRGLVETEGQEYNEYDYSNQDWTVLP